MAKKNKQYSRKYYNNFSKTTLKNDLALPYPLGGRLWKIGDHELLLTKTTKQDSNGNPIYMGTLMKRRGISKKNVSAASHILVTPF